MFRFNAWGVAFQIFPFMTTLTATFQVEIYLLFLQKCLSANRPAKSLLEEEHFKAGLKGRPRWFILAEEPLGHTNVLTARGLNLGG